MSTCIARVSRSYSLIEDKRDSTLFPDRKGRASILGLSDAKLEELFEVGKIAELTRRFSNSEHFFEGLVC